jgi:hypothetical protein
MEQMMILSWLSWSGRRLQHVINDEKSNFFQQEREKASQLLQSYAISLSVRILLEGTTRQKFPAPSIYAG